MKKLITHLAIAVFFIFSISQHVQAQNSKINPQDFFGTWTGMNSSSQVVELTLNSDYSCSYKVDGTLSYFITDYKLKYTLDNAGKVIPDAPFEIYLNTSSINSPNIQSAAPSLPPDKKVYKGIVSLTGRTLNIMSLSVDMIGSSSTSDRSSAITLNKQ